MTQRYDDFFYMQQFFKNIYIKHINNNVLKSILSKYLLLYNNMSYVCRCKL